MQIVAHQRAMETNILIHVLKKMEVGTVFTYAELEKSISQVVSQSGVKLIGDWRKYLLSARKWLEKNHGYIIGCIPRTGVKRLDPNETVAESKGYMRRAARATKRAVALADAAPDQHLSPASLKTKEHILLLAGMHDLLANQQEPEKEQLDYAKPFVPSDLKSFLETLK